MDHKRINKLIKKISNLNQNIQDDEEFSSMELEHMLNYIKKLYEEVSGVAMEEKAAAVKEAVSAPVVVAPVVEEVVIEEVIEEVEEEHVHDDEPEEIVVAEQAEPELPQLNAELLALFDEEDGTDLSDKLASRPIKTLTKAMGINEKIFTVKELFGGDQKEFDNMMVALDGLASFEDAKQVLAGSVAEKYEWASDKKIKKASTFIKLVRRRYN